MPEIEFVGKSSDIFEVIGNTVNTLIGQNIRPLHIIFNTIYINDNLDIKDFVLEESKEKELPDLKDDDFFSAMFGVPCSYLLLGANEVCCVILTDHPMISPAVASNRLRLEDLDRYKSEYVM